MSHIALANLFLDSFTPAISGEFSALFQSQYETVVPTRKGRLWQITVPLRGASLTDVVDLTISVEPTIKVLYDVEDDLLSLGFLPDQFPECVTIVSARGRDEDLDACSKLCSLIRDTFGALTVGARLSS